jgi:localization factor PodJL
MTAAAPWSVKGIDPRAREVAKELARRSGMTLGEWLNRIILEDDMPEEVVSEAQITARPLRAFVETLHEPMSSPSATPKPEEWRPEGARADLPPGELGRIAQALDRLTDRIEASETRTGLAIAGVEHSVRHAMARIETAEREQIAVASRFDAAAERLEAEQVRAAERLRQIETEGPRSAEALRALEGRIAQAETAGPEAAELIEDVVSRLGERLADAEARTTASLESLRGSLAELDQRLSASGGGARAEFEQRLEGLAQELTQRIEDARTEIAERLATSPSAAGVEARIERLACDLADAEQRSARAIETMGREVLTMAETLNRRVRSAEQRSAEAIEQVGGEIARIAGAVETRLNRTDQLHAEALERLGSEISRITERLTDRILQSERRAAQAIDDVGEQVAKVTERIEQRYERASSDLAERIRASEERTARLLEEARARLQGMYEPPEAEDEAEALEADAAPADAPAEPAPERGAPFGIFGADFFSRAEPVSPPALDPANPAFGAEDFEAAEAFVPLEEPVEERAEAEPESAAAPETPQLSTREVIEQARAAARAAAESAARDPSITAGERRPRPARSHRFLAGLKPQRAPSTWQTALMVAGGAAFLSVGAAGVVLMEGPTARQPEQSQPIAFPPRAAMALSPTAAASDPAPAAPAATAQPVAADGAAADYIAAVKGVERKDAGSLAKLKAVADGGYAPAQVFLARLYETGQAGVTVNLAEARRWTERAAEGGDPAAMHNLALFYFRGEGGPADPATAARWFTKAAQHGVVDSQYNLGLLYLSGSGVAKDPAQAYKWFSIAATAGDPEARGAAVDLESKLSPSQLSAMDRQVAGFEPQGAQPARTASKAQAAAPGLADAQKVLARLGYYKGKADGSDPKALKLALAAYQRDQGLAATGSLDPATASRLSVFAR